jgi:hypothetical protein
MIITGTSDKIQFKLGGAVTTTQLAYTVDYNNYTSTAVSLLSNNGTSNNTTAVDLVPSPSASQQNELRYCSIYNSDTATATVSVQVYDGSNTRIVFRAVLLTGEMMQYQLEKGWEVLDASGNKKNMAITQFNNTIKANQYTRPINITTANTLTTQVWYVCNLGRAEIAYSNINIVYRVTTAAATITYAELAIYAGNYRNPDGGFMVNGRNVGTTDVSGIVNSLGVKNTAVSVSGIVPGDYIYAVFAVQATTALQLRSMGYAAANNDYIQSTIAANIAGGRPSLVSTGPYINALPTQNIWFAWSGS